MPSTSNAAALMLALISLVTSEIQITQPAPKATTLALQPDTVVRWVYSSSDPELVGFIVRQVETDENYEPMLALYRGATTVSVSSEPIPLSTTKFEEGMNITIAITEITEEDQDDPLNHKVLASRGPLRLVEGSDRVQPVGIAGQSSTTESSDTESSSPGPSANAEATSTTDTSPSPTSADSAAATTSFSDADKPDTVTTLYVVMLIVTAIPAFLFGFNP